MEIITVEKLLLLCKQEVEKGNGKKQILISNDDEGNGFHSLFYDFTSDKDALQLYADEGMFHDNNNVDDIIILG
jgi:hypothetical protein